MRFACTVLLLAALAACNRGNKNADAVRQGVLDHLSQVGLNVAGMDVSFQSVEINGDKATAAVSITAKGGPSGSGMSSIYHMQLKDGKWVYAGRDDAGAPHGGGASPGPAAPGSPNPHAGMGGAPAGGAGGKMPSPEDLPPATKKQ